MKILIDTNIVLDFLLVRTPFFENAQKLMRMISDGKTQAYITANSITDIVYITRKEYSPDEIRSAIFDLLDNMDIIGVSREDIILAFDIKFNDFEDALQSVCSEKEDIDYIVTRNKKDFTHSKVEAIDISDFLSAHYR